MYRKSLISVLIVLMIGSVITVLAEEGVDLIVTVVGAPIADADGPYSGYSGRTTYFDGSGSVDADGTIETYEWDFGDGNIGLGIKPSHIYSSIGTYTVNLTVTDNDGLTDSDITTASITKKSSPPSPPPYYPPANKLPVAEAGSDQVVFIGEFVEFNGINSTDIDGTIISYDWDFGDGTTGSGVNVSHRYLEVGNYIVTLTVKDNRYGVDTDTCAIIVREHPIIIPPLPPFLSNLNITPAELELGDNVTIGLNITNPNNESISYIVTMEVGELTLLVSVDLEALESKLVSRTITPSLVGVYNVSVDGMTGSFMVEPVYIPPKPAEFVISSLTIIPEKIIEGEMVNVTIVITNIGDEAGNFSSEVVVLDGEYSTEFTIELLGGETTTITFDYLVEIIGTHTIKIDNLTASFTVLPHPLKPAEFVWGNFTYTSEIQEGDPLEVNISVVNIGEMAGNVVITIKIDGIDVHTLGGDLEPGGGSNKHWTDFYPFEVGTHTIQLAGFEGTFDVVSVPTPFWERDEFLPVIVLMVVMVSVGIIYIYYRKTDFSGWT